MCVIQACSVNDNILYDDNMSNVYEQCCHLVTRMGQKYDTLRELSSFSSHSRNFRTR